MQLIQKWSRLNPDECVDVPEDMTRLALDTIGLCGFNYRFNSFYREDSHPFVTSMVRALSEAMSQAQRLGIQGMLMVKSRRQFKQDIEFMFSLVDINIKQLSAEDLKHAVNKVLQHPIYKENTKKISQSFREAGGYVKAADEIFKFTR